MTFSEALKYKKSISKNLSPFTKTLYDYVIIPDLEEEGQKYLDDFRKSPSLFLDESCKRYSSNSQFRVCLHTKDNDSSVIGQSQDQ